MQGSVNPSTWVQFGRISNFERQHFQKVGPFFAKSASCRSFVYLHVFILVGVFASSRCVPDLTSSQLSVLWLVAATANCVARPSSPWLRPIKAGCSDETRSAEIRWDERCEHSHAAASSAAEAEFDWRTDRWARTATYLHHCMQCGDKRTHACTTAAVFPPYITSIS